MLVMYQNQAISTPTMQMPLYAKQCTLLDDNNNNNTNPTITMIQNLIHLPSYYEGDVGTPLDKARSSIATSFLSLGSPFSDPFC